MFVPVLYLWPSLTLAGKAKAYPYSGAYKSLINVITATNALAFQSIGASYSVRVFIKQTQVRKPGLYYKIFMAAIYTSMK